MGNPMKIRVANKDGVTEIKVLMNHAMETGLRKDAAGALIPALFITEVTAKLNDDVVMQAQWGTPRWRRTRSWASRSRAASRATRFPFRGPTARATPARTKPLSAKALAAAASAPPKSEIRGSIRRP